MQPGRTRNALASMIWTSGLPVAKPGATASILPSVIATSAGKERDAVTTVPPATTRSVTLDQMGRPWSSLSWPRAAAPPLGESRSQDDEGDQDDRDRDQAEQDLDHLDEDEQCEQQHYDHDQPRHRSIHLADLDGLRALPERASPNLAQAVTPSIVGRHRRKVIPGELAELAGERARTVWEEDLALREVPGVDQQLTGRWMRSVMLVPDAHLQVAKRNPGRFAAPATMDE